MGKMPPRAVPLASNETEVRVQKLVDGGITLVSEMITLTLLRGCVWFDEGKLKGLLPDAQLRQDAQNLVHCYDYSTLRSTYGGGGKLSFLLSGQKVTLTAGEHFFFSSHDAYR